jgi:SAM-dependent methyltransferase
MPPAAAAQQASEPAAAEPEPSPAATSLAPGVRVRIHGLQGRADLNGRHAELMHFVEDAQRWACYVLGSGEAVRVKPQNLDAVTPPLEAAARAPFWHEAKQCLEQANGDFAVARTAYFRGLERQLRDTDPALHDEVQANRHAGPGLEARVSITFDTAAAFLRSAQSGQEANPGLATEQRAIAEAACGHATTRADANAGGSSAGGSSAGGSSAGGDADAGPRVLDVGCGDGAYAPLLAACGASPSGYLGIDVSHNMVSRAKILHGDTGFSFARASFLTSSLCAPPFEHGGFDTVLFHATLQYLPDAAAAIARAVGCLRTDRAARIVVAQVTGASFVRREHAKHPAVAVAELPSPSELRELGKAHGFALLPRQANAPPLDEFYLLVLERPGSAAPCDVTDS